MLLLWGACDKTNNSVSLNLKAVIYAYENDTFQDVEYYAIHEIRHIFQHMKINELDEGINNGVEENLVK